jgi:SAM-dependent methyltransferase
MQISRLSETIKKPMLYEKGTASMWEDDHISRHLLDLHLNQDCDAASRKRTTIEKTVRWIEAHLDTRRQSILDLGCGPGLYCELLTMHGHRVTGIDFSQRSIAYATQSAEKKGLDIEYLLEDYLDLKVENRFDLVIMIFCDFDVLVPDNRARLLNRIHRALKPGGLFIFDTLNQHALLRMNIPGRSWEVAESGFWMAGPYLALAENIPYPEAHVILQQHVVYADPDVRAVYRFWTHYYPQEILVPILEDGGFSVAETVENLLPDDGPGTSDMVTFYVARKR